VPKLTKFDYEFFPFYPYSRLNPWPSDETTSRVVGIPLQFRPSLRIQTVAARSTKRKQDPVAAASIINNTTLHVIQMVKVQLIQVVDGPARPPDGRWVIK